MHKAVCSLCVAGLETSAMSLGFYTVTICHSVYVSCMSKTCAFASLHRSHRLTEPSKNDTQKDGSCFRHTTIAAVPFF